MPLVDLSEDAVTTTDLLSWSAEIAAGMAHLASRSLVHGDLALRNVLLTEQRTAKVSLFLCEA